jgi:V8-like Glu-specific endopeptidase
MRMFCVSIGIDGYRDRAWQLASCVNDAIAFADWAVTAGGVVPADLQMFLNPADTSPLDKVTLPKANLEVPCISATRNNIIGFIQKEMLTQHWGENGDRLYWYFAGHGCSHESVRGSPRPEPVLFPVDVESLPLNANNLISFNDIVEPLRWCGPAVQLFFLDACRDFALPNYASTAGAPSGRYFRKLPEEGGRAPTKQYILYATAPGERAVELGRGVFGEILIRGLSGDPGALLRVAGLGDYRLTYNRLAMFIRREVEAKVKKALLARPTRVVQIPEVDVDPVEPDFDVAEIPNAKVPPWDLYVRVRPQTAHATGRIQVYYENVIVPPPCGPPLQALNKLRLQPSYYRISAGATGMGEAGKTLQVPTDGIVELELPQAPIAAPVPTSLRFFTIDRNLLVQVWDPHNERRAELAQVVYQTPKQGLYRATVSSPDRVIPAKGYTFPACGAEVELDVPPIAISSLQLTALASADIRPVANTIIPSEMLGALSDLKVISLLGFSAYAAYVLREGYGSRLRKFGLSPLRDRTAAWVTVLIAATGYEPAPGTSIRTFLEKTRVALIAGRNSSTEPLRILEGFNTAGQALFPCPQGSFAVELRMPGLPITRYSMTGMSGRIGVLSLTVDDNQAVDAQQYLFSFDQNQLAPEDLPVLERAQRFYAGGRPIPDEIVDRLLSMKTTDPLQACLAGYSLARSRKHRTFVGNFIPGDRSWNPTSPLQNMLNFFDALPDTYVLAGLCEPEKRSEYYRKAVKRGIPLFSDGFRTLIDHFSPTTSEFSPTTSELFPAQARRAMRTLIQGSLFSAWLSWEPVIGILDSGFEPPPTYWAPLEDHRKEIDVRIAACGQIACKLNDGTRKPFGTGFLVSEDLVLTTSHSIAAAAELSPSGLNIWFNTAIDPADLSAARAAAVLDIDEKARLALLRLEAPIKGVQPIPIASSDIDIKRQTRIYVIGYPYRSLLSDAGLVQHLFAGELGIKWLQPGMVLVAPKAQRSIDHDASTLGGNAGSPVIDLDSGLAIGVHWGGMDEAGYKRNRATALVRPVNRRLLAHVAGQG